MDEKLHFWLTNLHRNIDKDRMKEAVLKVYDLRGKAGLMYGMAYISAVVEANGKAVKELSNEEGVYMGKVIDELLGDRAQEWYALIKQEGFKEGIKKGRIAALAELVRDGVITISYAAKKMGLSEADFKKVAAL